MKQADNNQALMPNTGQIFREPEQNPRQSPYSQRLERKMLLEQAAMAVLAAALLLAIL